MSEQQSIARKWGVPFAVMGAVVVGFIGLSGNGDSAVPEEETPAPVSTFGEGDAILNCEDAVRAELANPATADFSIFDTQATERGGGWDVAGTATAENDFGVKQEVAFNCWVKEGEPVEVEVSTN